MKHSGKQINTSLSEEEYAKFLEFKMKHSKALHGMKVADAEFVRLAILFYMEKNK